ncbi:MAG: hypothetical protein HGA87_04605 [Desulfobulbaceae bacterium]|nr:hypothetical protein [Desulfobulbaceae bacterium]
MKQPNDNVIWSAERPWTYDQIRISSFRDFQLAQKTIDSLPGGLIAADLEDMRLSLAIFLDATKDLLSSINLFKSESESPNFWDRPGREGKEALLIRIQRGIFSATMSAMALVDHSRIFARKYPVAQYDDKVKECFSGNCLHAFVQQFRNFMTHVRIMKSNWLIKHDEHGRSVFFLLSQDDLSKWNKWDETSKFYIASNPEGVNIEQLYEEYSKQVKFFHDWLRSQMWKKHSEELHEFYSCKKTYATINSECSWNVLIKQVFLPKKIDPYIYLDKYLSKEETEEVLSYPYKSKKQVDRIIEIVDEHDACNEELRQSVYQLFGVNS